MKYILLCVILLFSCDKSARDFSVRLSPEIEVERNDKEIERIAENARRALPIFFRNLARPEAGANNFFVKYPLASDDGGIEQVWLGGIHVKDGVYYSVLANTSRHAKKGGVIIIDTDKITDWMYIQDGKIMGGRSIKYLLEKIPENRRSEDQMKILKMFEN